MSLPLVIALAVAGVLALWGGGVALAGALVWKPVARRYPAARWPGRGEGVAVWGQTVTFGFGAYDAGVRAVLTEEALYLRPHVHLALNHHPPMRIPWSAMGPPAPTSFGGVKVPLDGGPWLRLRGRLARLVGEALASKHAGPGGGRPPGAPSTSSASARPA